MKGFLEKIAHYLHQNLYPGMENVLVLVPNKRTGLFLEKELMAIVPQPFILPQIQTIEDFIGSHSSYVEADPLEMNLSLYKIFKSHLDIYETFDQFYYWGEMLLRDFNDIDKNLVNARELFQLMQDEKEIDKQFQYLLPEQIEVIKRFWHSFTPPDFKGNQQDFIDTWRVLYEVYQQFTGELAVNGKAYPGMMFKQVQEKISSAELDLPFKKILFVGFHILSRSEEKIFNFYRKNKQGLFFWDVDQYYLANEKSKIKNHEAGTYLREYLKSYPNAIEISDFYSSPPNIHFVACPKNNGQVVSVRELIDQNQLPYNKKTAIVLADESMLIPTLQAVSKHDEPINITLGYSLKSSQVSGLIDSWLDIFKYKTVNKFYYKPVTRFLNNAYITALFGNAAEELQQDILANNLLYIMKEDLDKYPTLKDLLETDHTSSFALIKKIKELIEKIYYHYFDIEKATATEIFETEILYQSLVAFTNLENILDETQADIQPDTLKKLLSRYLNSVSVNFSGEPVVGLQIMGLLESRNLDFENVFILNANEGTLPATIASGSFIPYHLRKGFNLPTYQNNDSMFAYYVYRLLHHSKNIYFVYNNVADELSKAEPSRYIVQLQLESGLPYRKYQQKIEFNTPQILPIEVKKNELILEQLAAYYTPDSDKRLSPSALNLYMDCSLKFYFRYIAGIKETDTMNEEIDPATFGTLLHNTMENIYTIFIEKYQKKMIEKNDIPVLRSLVHEAIMKAMDDEFSGKGKKRRVELTGDNYIIFHIIEQYALNILNMDEQSAPKPVPIMETDKSFPYPFLLNGKNVAVQLGGRIDRIDIDNNTVKVVDYKTGKADKKKDFTNIHELFDRENPNRREYIFQIFLYAYLLELHEYQGKIVIPQLLFIRESYQKDFDAAVFLKNGKNFEKVNSIQYFSEPFKESMDGLLKEFFDPAIPYRQTIHIKKCEYCPYVDICNRRS